MKAVVFHGVGDIRLDNVPEPRIQQPTDAIVRLTGASVGGERAGEGSNARDHRGLPGDGVLLPGGDCNEPQPHHQDGKL